MLVSDFDYHVVGTNVAEASVHDSLLSGFIFPPQTLECC